MLEEVNTCVEGLGDKEAISEDGRSHVQDDPGLSVAPLETEKGRAD
jgi:hypothetical protein